MKELTKAQKRILDFLEKYASEHGRPPTVREVGKRFGIRSPNGVAVHLAALQRKGYLTRQPGIARGLDLPGIRRNLPLLGTIAAGRPIEAVERSGEVLDMDALFRKGEYFVLQVRGDSMVEDCIRDGDYVVVERREWASDGETVVALVNGNEATLKRFFKEKDRIRLEPANAQMSPIYVVDAQIQGVVRGVVRKY